MLLDIHYHVDVGLALGGYNYKIVVYLRASAFLYKMMSGLITKGSIISYSMRKRCIAGVVKPPRERTMGAGREQ